MALTPDRLKRVISRYHERLARHQEALNRLNVYPVPDGDTGTNMSLTMQAVLDEVQDAQGMQEVAGAIAHGSLMGARGNSGVILSQILRGLADTFREYDEVGTTQLVAALERASVSAYEAVLRPVEGTILTVLRVAAEAAAETGTSAGEDLGALLERVYQRAEKELENTPELLPVLKQAGVVDAGGAGFLLLIVAFLEEVTGLEVVVPDRIFVAAAAGMVDQLAREGMTEDLRYEVMYFLEADEEALTEFRDTWSSLGNSIVVVGGEGTYNCHIHTDHIGPAIEAGITAGRPFQIQITDLADQAAAESFHAGDGEFQPIPEFANAPVAVVPVAVGSGLVEMFRSLGAQGMVAGGQTMNPSTQDILTVVEAVAAECVILLPNNKNIVPVAEQVRSLSTKEVFVVPTTTIPQGLAAMVAYLPGRDDGAALAESMQAAAHEVATGELTRAVRDAVTPVGRVRQGDWLGIAEDEIVCAAADIETTLIGLLDRLVGDGAELVTLLTGSDAQPGATVAARRWLADGRPNVALEVTEGGQPLYPYLVSVE